VSKKSTKLLKTKKTDGPDKEKVKAVYNNDLISLEIIKIKDKDEAVVTTADAEAYYDARVQHRYYVIDDLVQKYIIRMSWTEKKRELQSVDPDHIEEADQYELSETIQEILRENLFPVIKSHFPEKPEKPEKVELKKPGNIIDEWEK
jgi:hypothetical protein